MGKLYNLQEFKQARFILPQLQTIKHILTLTLSAFEPFGTFIVVQRIRHSILPELALVNQAIEDCNEILKTKASMRLVGPPGKPEGPKGAA